MVKLSYKPDKGPEWIEEFPEKQAEKMLKLGRWKKVPFKAEPKPDTKK